MATSPAGHDDRSPIRSGSKNPSFQTNRTTKLDPHTQLSYYPCTVSEENISTAVPHFLAWGRIQISARTIFLRSARAAEKRESTYPEFRLKLRGASAGTAVEPHSGPPQRRRSRRPAALCQQRCQTPKSQGHAGCRATFICWSPRRTISRHRSGATESLSLLLDAGPASMSRKEVGCRRCWK